MLADGEPLPAGNRPTAPNGKIGRVTPDEEGNWSLPQLPIYQDWGVVLEGQNAREWPGRSR